jgi:hypothetical protein
MTFTYTPGGATDLDDIRAAIGDTTSTAPPAERLEDEEIERLLTLEGSITSAKVAAARALLAKLTRRVTEKTVGSLRLVYTQRIDALRSLIKDLELKATLAIPYAGGISQSDRAAVESNTDRTQPAFRAGMFDSPREA